MCENDIINFDFNKEFRNNFHKRHHFDYKNDVPLSLEFPKMFATYPGVKYESDVGNKALQLKIPDWITFSNQILCFIAHCEDDTSLAFGQKPEYKILYYLEDDTIQLITSNKMKTDHRFRATLLKRQRIPNPSTSTPRYYILDDFNVGKIVVFYGRMYKIIDCDKFTRDYLIGLGIQVPFYHADEEHKGQLNQDLVLANIIQAKKHTLKQFLENDGNVLQFYCLWDTSENENQKIQHDKVKPKKMILRYFLADDTVEVRESDPVSPTERPKSTAFIKRGKLPKTRIIEPVPYFNNRLSAAFYSDADFRIGNFINVWGRNFHIYDCDAFTKEFLKHKYGVGDFPVNSVEDIQSRKTSSVSNVSRRGTKTDLAGDSKNIRDEKDFVKFMTKDRTSDEGHVLRFLARPIKNIGIPAKEDTMRRFVISYHLMDDTISVFEQPQKNSGSSVKFIQRSAINKQLRRLQNNNLKNASDLYVGANIYINGHMFEIVDCDEYAKTYMEKHNDEFPYANHLEVLRKLKTAIGVNVQNFKKSFNDLDTNGNGIVNSSEFQTVMKRFADESLLVQHEILTLARVYSCSPTQENVPVNTMQISREEYSELFHLQNELRKIQFDDFHGLYNYLKCRDVAESGLMKCDELLRSCQAYPLPVKKYIIHSAILRFLRPHDEYISYVDFTNAIDWKSNPLSSVDVFKKKDQIQGAYGVNYKRLIHDMECFN